MAAIEELAVEVDRAEIIAGVEQAAGLAASRSSGRSLSARLDSEEGRLVCYVVKRVATEVEDPESEVAVDAAPEGSSPGDLVEMPVPFGTAARSAARAARAVLEARLGAARMLSRAERYRDRIGKLETAIVARREGHDLIVNLGPVEGRLPADEQSRHEIFNPEDTIRVAVHSIEPEDPPVILSRIAPEVLSGLIERETPEVRRGVVRVRAVARHPGIRAKVAVSTAAPGVDPVAACLGPGGSRIRAVSRELRGERVDLVLWNAKVEKFARNALRPAEVLDVRRADEDSDGGGSRRLREQGGLLVTVSETELPRAVGKRGQNVRLASELLGMPIEVAAEGDVSPVDTRSARRDSRDTGASRRDADRRRPDRRDSDRRDSDRRDSDRRRSDRRDSDRRRPDRRDSNRPYSDRRDSDRRDSDRRRPDRRDSNRPYSDRRDSDRRDSDRRRPDRRDSNRPYSDRRDSDRRDSDRRYSDRRDSDRRDSDRRDSDRRDSDRRRPDRRDSNRRDSDRRHSDRRYSDRRDSDRRDSGRRYSDRRDSDRRRPDRRDSDRRQGDPGRQPSRNRPPRPERPLRPEQSDRPPRPETSDRPLPPEHPDRPMPAGESAPEAREQ